MIDSFTSWAVILSQISPSRLFGFIFSLGAVCFRANEITKAITCFEYSLHMRKLLYGKDAAHLKIVQSLVYLGTAWAEYENFHRFVLTNFDFRIFTVDYNVVTPVSVMAQTQLSERKIFGSIVEPV